MKLDQIKTFIDRYIISGIYSIFYPIKRRKLDYSIMNSSDTIDYITRNKVSVSRYGDGEYDLIGRKGNGFQQDNAELSSKLAYVLEHPIPDHLICIPSALKNVKGLRLRSKLFWMAFVTKKSELVYKNTLKGVIYGDSLFTRFYIIMRDRRTSPQIANHIKQIWQGRNICIVEGESTRLGIGNDLLEGAHEITRILCPSQNAFDKYNEIRAAVNENVSKDTLILCALGMAATVLTYDLTLDGYQAIDIGHVDVEYMWMKMGAKTQCPIPGKFVNEAPSETSFSGMEDPFNQVLCKV